MNLENTEGLSSQSKSPSLVDNDAVFIVAGSSTHEVGIMAPYLFQQFQELILECSSWVTLNIF